MSITIKPDLLAYLQDQPGLWILPRYATINAITEADMDDHLLNKKAGKLPVISVSGQTDYRQ